MATDPQSLLNSNDVSCYLCGGQATLYKLALLRQILLALNPMADTSPQGLLNNNDVSCYECFYSPWLLELALLRQIAINGTGGGGTGTIQVLSYAGADANTAGIIPADPTKDAIAYSKTGVGPTMGWNGATWV